MYLMFQGSEVLFQATLCFIGALVKTRDSKTKATVPYYTRLRSSAAVDKKQR